MTNRTSTRRTMIARAEYRYRRLVKSGTSIYWALETIKEMYGATVYRNWSNAVWPTRRTYRELRTISKGA